MTTSERWGGFSSEPLNGGDGPPRWLLAVLALAVLALILLL